MRMFRLALLAATATALALVRPALTQTTAFTYQGSLEQSGSPANGQHNFAFTLWTLSTLGTQVGPTLTLNNVQVTDGLFSVQLDFGATAFTNADRWLQVAVDGQTLAPRTLLTPTPFSLKTRGISVDSSQHVGIGTTSPAAPLHVSGVDQVMARLTSSDAFGTWLDLQNNSLGGGTWSLISSGLANGEGPNRLLIYSQATGQTAVAFRSNGNVGFGTGSPKQKIHNIGDYYGLGHLWLYAFEGDGQDGIAYVQARDDSGSSSIGLTLRTQLSGAIRDAIVLEPGGRANAPLGLFVGGADPNLATAARLYVQHSNAIFAAPVVRLNRPTEDGTMIEFDSLGASRGSITVSGNTVSYNAFTGSHYAFPDTAAGSPASIDRGALVRMTGNNLTLTDDLDSEVVYGVAPTATANDPACLGAFLAPLSLPDGANIAPSLVMGEGNGDMWVVDSGVGAIEPGDELISSDVVGCAMKDDPGRFAVGHVIARAAQRVDWSFIAPDCDGVRRTKISVLFTSYTRHSETAPASDARVAALEEENQALRDRLDALEALVRTKSGE
ncbi:MAG: hypothetical protein R3B57_01540 [Phycisphaerales bacterium]